jgi:hypothetical protein
MVVFPACALNFMKSAVVMNNLRLCRAATERQLGFWGRMLGLSITAAGIVVIANGYLAVGSAVLALGIPATWLTGVWVAPRSQDSYARRMTRLVPVGFTDAQRASREQVDRLRAVTAAIARLEPPDEFANIHKQVLGILQAIDDVKRDDPTLLPQRTVRLMILRQQLSEVRGELESCAALPYRQQLADALDARTKIANETPEVVQGPLRHQRDVLARVAVPSSWRDRHDAYTEQLVNYLAALSRYHQATLDGGVEEAESAARDLIANQRQREELVNSYGLALREYYTGRARR